MASSYATAAQYAAYDGGEAPAEIVALLKHASDKMDEVVLRAFDVDSNGLPTNAVIAEVLQRAACAQVQYWVRSVGEEHDIEGMEMTSVSVLGLSIDKLPPSLAPRANRILRNGGMLHSTHVGTTHSFFGREAG